MGIHFIDLLPSVRAFLGEQKRFKMLAGMKRRNERQLPAGRRQGITNVKLEQDGTVRTYVEGAKYPTRFYTRTDEVYTIASFKRLFSLLMSGGLTGMAILYFGRKILSAWLGYVFEMNNVLLKEEHWSQPVKEIRRILKGRMDENFVDGISLILQTDMAYCYRMQDALGNINKELFNQNPIKELKRILDIYIARDVHDKNKAIGRNLKRALWILNFKGLKMIKKTINDLKVEEVRLSVEDEYWTNIQEGYDFRGLSLKERRNLAVELT